MITNGKKASGFFSPNNAKSDRWQTATDGVTEAFDPEHSMFGEERLEAVVHAHAQGSAAGLVKAIASAVRDHAGAAPQSDDITILVLRIEGA